MTRRMVRAAEADKLAGVSKTTRCRRIAAGLWTPPVKLGARASAWPDDELDTLNKALIAGKTEDEIRALVAELVAARSKNEAA